MMEHLSDKESRLLLVRGLRDELRKNLLGPYFITNPSEFSFSDHDPDEKEILGLNKDEGQKLLAMSIQRLSGLQELLYANSSKSLLIVLQAMDAGGKDGTIKHVMSGINPQGVSVVSFKQPSKNELARSFLWRVNLHLPAKGRIGIFNRSHYEDVLISRVHPEMLKKERVLMTEPDEAFWNGRYEDICNFEKHLVRSDTVVLKFFLHISKKEQKKRFLQRLEDDTKLWKFSLADMQERQYWDSYQTAYEEMIIKTSTSFAPWVVVPADRKWFARLVVIESIIQALLAMNLSPPTPAPEVIASLKKIREDLLHED
ncbi:polyphosphate kinase 2 family protein [Entomobacter blattae]|uniref:Polyphosphate:ADP phosphotransferase n=1 Tax=Entomobacter blattae TaxID=2762277 RepID=A0A7H1NTJ9_9PROT|nr:polyphosphate kinase 2 family protein [Entomobacter blattae]QNT79109.1 Polyphosphate:ADP phosphotransferase [Entomobacter blattae]